MLRQFHRAPAFRQRLASQIRTVDLYSRGHIFLGTIQALLSAFGAGRSSLDLRATPSQLVEFNRRTRSSSPVRRRWQSPPYYGSSRDESGRSPA